MKEKGKKIVRARQFTYVQDTDHLKVEPKQFQDFLSKSGAVEWAYILHDKDADQNNKISMPIRRQFLRLQIFSKIRNNTCRFGMVG